MAAANLAFWFSQIDSTGDPALVPLLLLFVVPLVLFLVHRWHLKVCTPERMVQQAPEPGRPERAPGGPAAGAAKESAEGEIERAIDAMN